MYTCQDSKEVENHKSQSFVSIFIILSYAHNVETLSAAMNMYKTTVLSMATSHHITI